jgi:hypothetical protein
VVDSEATAAPVIGDEPVEAGPVEAEMDIVSPDGENDTAGPAADDDSAPPLDDDDVTPDSE